MRVALKIMMVLLSVSAAACGGKAEDCCKTCKESKACGDTCIAKNLDCNQPKGCACDD